MKDDRVYLRHIQECIRRIEENISQGRQQFMASHTLQDAVLRSLQTLSESADGCQTKRSRGTRRFRGAPSQHSGTYWFTTTSGLTWTESGKWCNGMFRN